MGEDARPLARASDWHAIARRPPLVQEIRIEFTRFSAFYSPLIATFAGGFLQQEGLTPKHSVSAPGKSAIAGLVDGSVHVCQSAPSQGFMSLEQGKKPPALHFAQINEKDGFFLAGRSADKAFTWDKLKGKRVIVDHGGQPMAMFKYACFKKGVDVKDLKLIDVGSTENMIAAFRKGDGDYVHLQGPGPQQLEHDRVGHVVAALADASGICAFSSLAATREWLDTDMAKRFTRAYRKARAWLHRHAGGRGRQGRGAVLQGYRPAGADEHDRHLPEARQLDAAYRDHQASFRGGARHLPARRPDHQAPRLRRRGGAAAGVIT